MTQVSHSKTAEAAPTKWLVFAAVALVFFFLNLSTFQSLGVVLFTMIAELHWSYAAAGGTFFFLGIACGLSSPLPGALMERIGGRATIFVGAILLTIGFALCSVSHSLFSFYVGMGFLGIGYSFAGNVPGVYLIAGWFKQQSARFIGYYFMLGALGASVAPPIVNRIVAEVGWRGHWQVMAAAVAVIGVVCLLLIRNVDPSMFHTTAEEGQGVWTPRHAMLTPQFLLIAAAMASTMACVTTTSAVIVMHLVKLGDTPADAAFVFSALALTATLVKAVSGWLCERYRPVLLTAAGLLVQAVGIAILGYAGDAFLRYGAAITFGIGWGLTYVAGTVVLLRYFDGRTGSKILSAVWFLTSIAAAGPPLAGKVADLYGTFAPVFVGLAILSALLAIPIVLMRAPTLRAGAISDPLQSTNFAREAETA